MAAFAMPFMEKRPHHRTLHHVAWVWLVHARIARAVRQRDAKAGAAMVGPPHQRKLTRRIGRIRQACLGQ